jgi:hypothetical protein
MSIRLHLWLSLLFITAALTLPAGASALEIGVGDQTPAMFSDPRFKALAIHYARLDVPWNVVTSPSELQWVSAWLQAARADSVVPLITFDHPSTPGWHHTLPSAARFGQRFSRFHALFPWVVDYATWNEANYCGEVTCHRPAAVAAYYRQIRRRCPACTVIGAELLDEPNMVQWAHQFRAALGGEPMVWGLHNYIGANRLQATSTKALIRATRAPM